MKTVIVLAMHGALPQDFPRAELGEFFALHARHEAHDPTVPLERYTALENKLRCWPRSPENDPFYAASYALAQAIAQESGLDVVVGFNEFCAPDLPEALALAVKGGAERVVVATAMLTRGGEHAEREIALAVERGRQQYPGVEIVYAWPYESADVARFITGHIQRFTAGE